MLNTQQRMTPNILQIAFPVTTGLHLNTFNRKITKIEPEHT